MNDISVDEALKLGIAAHKLGKLREADKYYTAILDVQPNHVDANHNLGLIAVSLGKSDLALPYLKKALDLKPSNYQFSLSFIKALIETGNYDKARKCINNTRNFHPVSKDLDNLLKKISIKNTNFDTKNINQEILTLYQNREFTKVIDKCEPILPDNCNSVNFLNILGASLSALKFYDKAIEIYKRALKIQPDSPDVNNNFGNALRRSGDVKGSLRRFNAALRNREHFFDGHLNKGHALFDLGQLGRAIESYERALKIRPNSEEAFLRIGNTFKKLGKLSEACKNYQSVLQINPRHEVASHLLKSLSGENTQRAPRKYVEGLFDYYAKNFEHSLVDKLSYEVPQKLVKLMETEGLTEQPLSVLDMGCGTGLFGDKVKAHCELLHGVDISSHMLDVARSKGVYDFLKHDDIQAYLSCADLCYNCFVATDVFIYLGDLDYIFKLIKGRASKGGYLLFSTEHTNTGGYKLQKSARFSHSKSYIEELCSKYVFRIIRFELTDLRKETSEYIPGALYILSF